MDTRSTLLRAVSAAALAMTLLAGVSGNAVAQSWDWGGEKKEVASSGRQIAQVDAKLPVGQILVSFSDRRLYYVTKPGEALSYPIAIPRQQDDWQGAMVVSEKKINPSWTPTPTMIKENPRLPAWVPGGHPYNPLGVRALYLGSSAYRIHGTDAPWTIGSPVSKGCIRMYNKDVVDLYDKVKLGTKVTVTWNSFNGSKVVSAEDKRRETYGGNAPGAAAPQATAAPATVTASEPAGRTATSRSSGSAEPTGFQSLFGGNLTEDVPEVAPKQPRPAPAQRSKQGSQQRASVETR